MSLELVTPAPEEPSVAADGTWLKCIARGAQFVPLEDVRCACDDCDGLLEIRYASPPTRDDFEGRGIWHYNVALPFGEGVSLPKGATPLHEVPCLRADAGVETLRAKHEGMDPAGSFKDRGMTVGVRVAKELGVDRLICASTDNTFVVFATYGAHGGMETLVLPPAGKVVTGKVTQASFHDTRILEVNGSFDSCLNIVQDLVAHDETYLLNPLNPLRLEGQKTIGFEILEELHEDYGNYPDRIVLPVGNTGNTSALYKAFRELVRSGALDVDDVPKLTGVQAEGAAPMVEAIGNGQDGTCRQDDVKMRAAAIHISNPVNASKTLPGIREIDGTAVVVSDEEITAVQHDPAAEGVGIEPAFTASVTGLRKPRAEGVVDTDEQVVCLTAGHLLKNPDAAFETGNDPGPVLNDTEVIFKHLAEQARPVRPDRG